MMRILHVALALCIHVLYVVEAVAPPNVGVEISMGYICPDYPSVRTPTNCPFILGENESVFSLTNRSGMKRLLVVIPFLPHLLSPLSSPRLSTSAAPNAACQTKMVRRRLCWRPEGGILP